MEIIVKDRQTLLDIAIATFGSAAGVFAFVRRNGISLTSALKDGQALTYEAADIIAPAIRDAYEVGGISPATDIDRTSYLRLLAATGSPFKSIDGINVGIPVDLPASTFEIDPLEEALSDVVAGRPPKENTEIHLTRIFQNPFDDTFA
nr:MAG TPA_asm: hypothetical protein [Caudoviricetes sp.]